MSFRKPLFVLLGMALALVLSHGAFAAPIDNKKLQERYDALMKKYNEGMKAYRAKNSEYHELKKSAKTKEEKKKALEVLQEAFQLIPSPKLAPKFAKLAKEDPKSEIGKKSMFFVLRNILYRNSTDPKTNQIVVDLVKEHHYQAKDIGQAMDSLIHAYQFDPVPLFEKVLAKNPHKECKALACYYWATRLMNKSSRGKKPDPKALELMERVVKEFADVKYRNRTLGKVAAGAVFEFNYLQIGMTVPDIEGEDVDGKKFKLSEYRGKVVMIDFWGDW